MNKKEWLCHVSYEALIILTLLALLTFICRIWPILLLIILGIFIAALRLLFLSVREIQIVQPNEKNPVNPKPVAEADTQSHAFLFITKQVSQLVSSDYPGAKWVWELPNARRLIESGEDVYILLNRAAGYRRAKVIISDQTVESLEYQTLSVPAIVELIQEEDDQDDIKTIVGEPVPENYDLVAFEWVEKHLMELNNRCNEAIGLGQSDFIVLASELPARESWESICKELKRNELKDVQCTDEGIKIRINQ